MAWTHFHGWRKTPHNITPTATGGFLELNLALSAKMPTREVWPLMLEEAARHNRENGVLAGRSQGEEDADEAQLPEGVVPMFYGTMLGLRLNLTRCRRCCACLSRTSLTSNSSRLTKCSSGDTGLPSLHGWRAVA